MIKMYSVKLQQINFKIHWKLYWRVIKRNFVCNAIEIKHNVEIRFSEISIHEVYLSVFPYIIAIWKNYFLPQNGYKGIILVFNWRNAIHHYFFLLRRVSYSKFIQKLLHIFTFQGPLNILATLRKMYVCVRACNMYVCIIG